MEKPYFVILNTSNEKTFMPMFDDDDNLAMFDSEISATVAGNKNLLGSVYGFEVFEIGGGVDYAL